MLNWVKWFPKGPKTWKPFDPIQHLGGLTF